MVLNKDEEGRLGAFLGVCKADLAKDVKYASEFYVSSVLWLAEKLKECNDELKKFKEEVNKVVDEEWQRHWERNKEGDEKVLEIPEVYKNPKNEISDRFYPR